MQGVVRKYKISLITGNILSKEEQDIIEILDSYFGNLVQAEKIEGYLPSFIDIDGKTTFWYSHIMDEVYIPRSIFERLCLVCITTTEIKDYINYYYNFDFKNCYYGAG